ncbi:MAG: hypothetical protein HDR30_03790, partial [Lachnospiraceae bacterium]|nr:hypothetical protein [Lachnospiraceae bacterium]
MDTDETIKSIDAYVDNHKRAIEKFVDKLTVEICKDIDRYKEEIMNGMAADNVIEDVNGSLSSLETQYSAVLPIEDKETALSMETKEAVLSIKTIEWMKEVEQYAVKYKLTSEILESINQCKKRIKAENADWKDINLAVEKLLEDIGSRVMPETEENAGGMKEVSVQVFKAQMQKITEKCHAENEAAEKFMIEYGTAAVKKVYDSMQKISAARTYLAEMKNENLYLDFFLNIEKEYGRKVVLLIQGLFRDIAKNYIQILDEMQTVLQSIEEYLPDKKNNKICNEYKEEKSSLDKKMMNKADKLEFGSSEIALFGQKTKGAVKSITKKWQRKKKMLTFLPIFLLICSILFEAIIAQEQIRGLIESAAENDFMMRFGDVTNKIPWNAVGNFLYSVVAFVFVLFTSLKSLMVVAVVLIIVFFIAYIKFLRYWCDNQICRQCEEYLKIELAQFDNQNTLMIKMEKTVRNAVEEYEQENHTVLEHIFSEIEYGSAGANKAEVNWFMD